MAWFVTLAFEVNIKIYKVDNEKQPIPSSDAISIFGASVDESSSTCIIGTPLGQTMAYRSIAPDPASSRNHHFSIYRQRVQKNHS